MARFELKARDWLAVPERKRFYNELHFSEAAPRYDAATRAMSLFRDASWKARLVASLPDLPTPVCVDIGCGTGDVALRLATRYPGGRIAGVDIARPMLRIARERNRHGHVRFLRQDMCAMDFPDDSVDVVTGSYALRNAPDLPRALQEIGRIVKPGGTAAFLDFAKPGAACLQALQRLLLRTWCGFWGLVLHGTPEVHGYIAESLAAFPDRSALLRLFGEHGFDRVSSERFFLGITELLVLRRRTAECNAEPESGDPPPVQ
jgi:ubiquinone/menaquinone biosynthesis methyltransferase